MMHSLPSFNSQVNPLSGLRIHSQTVLLLKLLILSIFCCLASQQDSPITQVQVDTSLEVTARPGYNYFRSSLTINPQQDRVLLITVDTELDEYFGIYTSLADNEQTILYPNATSNSQSCTYSSLLTCALRLPDNPENQTLQVYFSIQVFEEENLSIEVSVVNEFQGQVGHTYTVDFSTYEAGVITLPGTQLDSYEQILVQMIYKDYNSLGKFSLFAALDGLPTDQTRIDSRIIGALGQMLILEPIEDNSTYFIVLEGTLGTKFELTIQPFSKSSPSLQMNGTVYYYSSEQMIFTTALAEGGNPSLPLFLDLASLGGYGEFEIEYCEGLTNFTFQNINGQSGEVFIPAQQRVECYQNLEASGVLLLENLAVKVTGILWTFSFSIGLFEGEYPLQLTPQTERMGSLTPSHPSRQYSLSGYVNQSYLLKFRQTPQEPLLSFKLLNCKSKLLKKQSCSTVAESGETSSEEKIDPRFPNSHQFNFTLEIGGTYRLLISAGSKGFKLETDVEFVLLLLAINPKPMALMPLKPVISLVEENEYQFYVVNLSQVRNNSQFEWKNQTQVTIRLTATHGGCTLLCSLEREHPNFDMVFQENSVVDYVWNGVKTYNLSPFNEAIYIAVLGNSESIYQLQFSVNTRPDSPDSFTRLVGDELLQFTLSDSYDQLLLSYHAHSIPYTIVMSPQPGCVQFGYSLPLEDSSCRSLPQEITQQTIYLKISNPNSSNKDFKFNLYVYSGSLYLFENSPILIGCQSECYELVKVYLQSKLSIVHRGMGAVQLEKSSQNSSEQQQEKQSFSNQKISLQCPDSYPCFVEVNATLPFGGEMQLFYASDKAQEINWMPKPLTFTSVYEYSYFYMKVSGWSSINTAIFYTEGVSVQVFYNIYRLRQNASNALQYSFPNSYSYMGSSATNSLSRFHVVELNKTLISELGCENWKDICIATFSVLPKTQGDFLSQAIQKSVGYFSSNTFKFYIPLNEPYQLSQQYSLIYFTHLLPSDFSSNLTVKVQPLSSCRPRIFPQQNSNLDTSYYSQYRIPQSQLKGQNPQVNFSISSNRPCQYVVWLLDSEIEPLLANRRYKLQSDSDGKVFFIFNSKFLGTEKSFTVKLSSTASQIATNIYSKNPQGVIQEPSVEDNLALSTQSATLFINNTERPFAETYLVRILANCVECELGVEVIGPSTEVVLFNNEENVLSFSSDRQSFSFLYYTNNDFLLFVSTSGEIKVTVTDFSNIDAPLVEKYLTEDSSPWVQVNVPSADIRQYLIGIENVIFSGNARLLNEQNYPRVKFHVEESGTNGLARLYEGQALFDAFYTRNGQNCYRYLTEPIVGREYLYVDIIFSEEWFNKLPQLSYTCTLQETILETNFSSLPTGFRLSTQFYGDQTYKICFSLQEAPQLISQEYYVLVENQEYSLKHLTLDFPVVPSYPLLYEIMEYVAIQDQQLMVQLVNCRGTGTLLGSKSYSDIYLGQVSELSSIWHDQVTSVATISLNRGYFYFGVKVQDFDSRYSLRIQILEQGEKVHYDGFEIKQKQINSIKLFQEDEKQYLKVDFPPLNQLQTADSGLEVGRVEYNLVVEDLESFNYPSSVLVKCPSLSQKPIKTYTYIQFSHQSTEEKKLGAQKSVRESGQQGQKQGPLTYVPIEDLPEEFNLTGYVNVEIRKPYPQSLTYYYESSSFRLEKNDRHTSIGVMAVFLILVMIGTGIILVFLMYKRWKRNRSSSVSFEMTGFTQQQQEQPPTDSKYGNGYGENYGEKGSPAKSIRKALNSNVGYGEFVDESM